MENCTYFLAGREGNGAQAAKEMVAGVPGRRIWAQLIPDRVPTLEEMERTNKLVYSKLREKWRRMRTSLARTSGRNQIHHNQSCHQVLKTWNEP